MAGGPEQRESDGTARRDAQPEGDQRAYAALLAALTQDLVELETHEVEREASASRSPAEIEREEVDTARDEQRAARDHVGRFRAALDDARARGGADGLAEVPYDAADRRQDLLSDALIQYLVRPGFAEVRTEERDPGHYVYYIRVDWPRLRRLAEKRGHHLAL